MLIAFELSMPHKASWDRKWSGEDRTYVKVLNFSKKNFSEKLLTSDFFYNWPDGWGAKVSLRKVDSKEAKLLRKKSVGFAGDD